MKFVWEQICSTEYIKTSPYYEYTWRAKVTGGWIARHEVRSDYRHENTAEGDDSMDWIETGGFQKSVSTLVFVPDPDHEWKIDEVNHEEQ